MLKCSAMPVNFRNKKKFHLKKSIFFSLCYPFGTAILKKMTFKKQLDFLKKKLSFKKIKFFQHMLTSRGSQAGPAVWPGIANI